MDKIYDVIIIGSGPAGSTAALYLSRYARKTLVLSSGGGCALESGIIENWPGISSISGMELSINIQNHAKEYGTEFILEEVKKVEKNKDFYSVFTEKNIFNSKTVIFANGSLHKKLNIPKENELIGRGVSYCVTCDGMFYKNKDAIIIGGNDTAAKAALYLSEIANNVTVLYRKQKLRCEAIYLNKIDLKENIKVIYNSVPLEIIGDKNVEAIKIKTQKGEEQIIKTNGIFIEIGSIPSSNLAKELGVHCNEDGYIKVNKKMQTNLPGIYAAGDITDEPLKQLITSSAQGATAAYAIHEYLHNSN
ncbi:MAG: FAD-dependent oxidoreductase [Candidatus Nanoarchaeia archaeon]|jgi:thioredoxin reductase (NADPH)|nr:FAD-dependent oxidoreductase [Candidatus Nanoarchaeia archaeon]MDD3993823.1 FAD-dependent oxidoreductase [Candidatus Nanoarchaeia archaeon]MDD4563271.1 FAD-dependent oxidoreductase [Candidatus Nanoarchaeia archaeon]